MLIKEKFADIVIERKTGQVLNIWNSIMKMYFEDSKYNF